MLKKELFFPIIVALVLVLSACGNNNQGMVNEGDTPPVTNESPDSPSADERVNNKETSVGREEVGLGPMEAFNKYMEKYSNTKVEEISLDENLGSYVYKVEGYDNDKEYTLKISAVDGSIIKEEVENDNDHKQGGEIIKAHIEKIEKLVGQAMEDAGEGAKLDEWSLEFEDGIAVLEIEIDIDGFGDIEYKYNVETEELIKKDK